MRKIKRITFSCFNLIFSAVHSIFNPSGANRAAADDSFVYFFIVFQRK